MSYAHHHLPPAISILHGVVPRFAPYRAKNLWDQKPGEDSWQNQVTGCCQCETFWVGGLQEMLMSMAGLKFHLRQRARRSIMS